MGSSLSGRRDGKPLVEDCLTLDLARLMRLAPIQEGLTGSGEIRWSLDGETIGVARFRLDLRTPETARLLLSFRRTASDSHRSMIRQEVALSAMAQHLGGRRWWMLCPVSGGRVRTLHLPASGDRFASRSAWGLAYRVERLDRFDRPFEKLLREQRRLGSQEVLAAGLDRPKGMWRRTYARHIERFTKAEMACLDEIAHLIERA